MIGPRSTINSTSGSAPADVHTSMADPADIIRDMVDRGLIRRGSKMLREHQEIAEAAAGRHMRRDSPFYYWYVAV